jgi:RNA polymerase sigma-70 factor (ECF subfamily)
MQEIDRITVAQARKGDLKAFRRIYDYYSPFAWKVIFRTVNRDANSAAEALQETFVRFHGALRKFRGDSALSTWIYRIAYNAAITHAERHRRYTIGHVDLETAEAALFTMPADAGGAKDQVRRILDSLSPDDRFILVAREIDGMTFEEIASATGKNEGALRTQLHRIKERLKKGFGDDYQN